MALIATPETESIRVLTFNLWGIFNSKVRRQRMEAFAKKVANYDIILLQEQFSEADFRFIRESMPAEVREQRYFRRFDSGFYGSGCAVISVFPIESTFLHTYPLQGYPEMLLHGDYFANKSAALITVTVPCSSGPQKVRLYTTHLVAVYEKASRMTNPQEERYLPYRVSQAISFADFITATASPSDAIIIGGDFNAPQTSLELQLFRLLLKRRGFQLSSALPAVSPPQNIVDNMESGDYFTYSEQNRFNAMKTSYFKLLKLQGDLPTQIDHLFYNNAFTVQDFQDCPDTDGKTAAAAGGKGGAHHHHRHHSETGDEDGDDAGRGVLVFTRNEVPFNSSAEPTMTSVPISDHFGVAVRLQLRPAGAATSSAADLTAAAQAPLTEEEEAVLSGVEELLQFNAQRLHRQYTQLRLASLVFGSLFAIGLVKVLRDRSYHFHLRTDTVTLVQRYIDASNNEEQAQRGSLDKVADGAIRVVKGAAQWSVNGLRHGDWKLPTLASQPTGCDSHGAAHTTFNLLKCVKHLTPLSSVAHVFMLAIAPVGAFGSAVISLTHRCGNAKLMHQQANALQAEFEMIAPE